MLLSVSHISPQHQRTAGSNEAIVLRSREAQQDSSVCGQPSCLLILDHCVRVCVPWHHLREVLSGALTLQDRHWRAGEVLSSLIASDPLLTTHRRKMHMDKHTHTHTCSRPLKQKYNKKRDHHGLPQRHAGLQTPSPDIHLSSPPHPGRWSRLGGPSSARHWDKLLATEVRKKWEPQGACEFPWNQPKYPDPLSEAHPAPHTITVSYLSFSAGLSMC